MLLPVRPGPSRRDRHAHPYDVDLRYVFGECEQPPVAGFNSHLIDRDNGRAIRVVVVEKPNVPGHTSRREECLAESTDLHTPLRPLL